MKQIKEINVDGVDYVEKSAVKKPEYSGEWKICVLQRGWVFVGKFEKDDKTNHCKLHDAKCIEKWGTTDGLGQLADGPLPDTRLREARGVVEFDFQTAVCTISVNYEAWEK